MQLLEIFKQINTLVFDVDGVLTNGTLFVMPNGLMARQMNIKDGYALQLAVKKGYKIIIISGGNSPEVKDRLEKLGVDNVFMSVKNKKELLGTYLAEKNISAQQVLFMGDDIPDYDVMQIAALPCCPADAAEEIKQVSKYISPLKGGEGCARDVIEKVLKLRGDWEINTVIQSR